MKNLKNVIKGCLFGAAISVAIDANAQSLNPNDLTNYYPLILGHRGACGHRPEHTKTSYLAAIKMGADFIEPDLVVTKDGEIVIRHEYQIGGTTNISKLYPTRKNTYIVDGEKIEDWFVNDFTLDELQKVRAVERVAYRREARTDKKTGEVAFDEQYPIMTFEEFIQLIQRQEKKYKKQIKIVPEIKHSTFTASLNLPITCNYDLKSGKIVTSYRCTFEDKVLEILHKYGYDRSGASQVIIQSFEIENLKYIKKQFNGRPPYKLLQLIDEPQMILADEAKAGRKTTYKDLVSEQGMKEIAIYADFVGLWKWYIQPFETKEIGNEKKIYLKPTTPDVVKWAHDAQLGVIVYTFRSDKENLAVQYADKYSEYYQYFDLKVDGVFTDFSDDGVEARQRYLNRAKK